MTSPLQPLRTHWPEYLIEGWALGMFMVSAGLFATLLNWPHSPVYHALHDEPLRRALGGAWTSMWLYFVAPALGMFVAATCYRISHAHAGVHCAKLDHSPRQRCIHCGYQP